MGLNRWWSESRRGRLLSILNVPIVTRRTKIFTIGSCFAIEIKRQLREHGFNALPDFSRLRIDKGRQYVNGLPEEEKYAFYDTFTIRQEYENAFAPWDRGPESFWVVKDRPINQNTGWPTVYQDPYRKTTFGADLEAIEGVTKQLDTCIAEGIREAEVHVITLGLIETWRVKATGRYSCRPPATAGAGGANEAEFHLSTYEENVENLRRVFSLIFANNAKAHVVLTVSPVALEATATTNDVVVANMESKSLLRAVAGTVSREFENVHYFPSYEFAMNHDIFEEDGRHVTRDAVARIITLFFQSFGAEGLENGLSDKLSAAE